MAADKKALMASIPSVDRVLGLAGLEPLIEEFGRPLTLEATRDVLERLREEIAAGSERVGDELETSALVERIEATLRERSATSLVPIFNLTGTVLHTNLGRAPMPEAAIDAVARVARGASNLEFDLAKGRRGDRDDHLEERICRLTGAEAATVVNNNAAAVLLVLNTLALRKEVAVSRGELIEIGGAFRIPDIMSRAGAKLHEVGTTNRTHLRDYENAISSRMTLFMKVHTSNYSIEGFTASAGEGELADLAHANDLALAVDLGSGTLVDLERYGLPHEPTARETLAAGADVVTFSGDKLLGGPQAGIIAGKADIIRRIKRNPLKRALRVDKMTIAALESIFALYENPDALAGTMPVLRILSRPRDDIRALAESLEPVVADAAGDGFIIEVVDCASQIGSGSLPAEILPSAALAIRPAKEGRGADRRLRRLADAFRALPVPVIGRIADGAFVLDLRCLEDEAAFREQLTGLEP